MNVGHDLEHEIASVLTETAPVRPPEHLLPSVISSARRKRRWPRWYALVKEPTMHSDSRLTVGSPTARVAAVLAATLLLALLVAGAGIAGARLLAADGTIVVAQDGSGTVETITEAVAMAEDGDTILVRPGSYDESVTLTKDITIRGDGDRDTIIVELSVETRPGASGMSPDLPAAFLFDGSDASLENLTLRGESARIVISGGAPVLRDLVLDGIGRVYRLDPGPSSVPTGLELNDGTTATVTDSVLIDTDVDIETGSSPSLLANEFTIGAIWMEGVGVDPVIRDNVIVDSVKWGISVNAGARPIIEANTITNAQTAVEISTGGFLVARAQSDPIVRANKLSDSRLAAISLGTDTAATIERNELTDNGTGITVGSGSDVMIDGNRIEGGSGGLIVMDGSPRLVDNVVEGVSGQGILVGRGTSPILTGNTSCNNGENLKIIDGATPDIDDTNEICPDAPAEATE